MRDRRDPSPKTSLFDRDNTAGTAAKAPPKVVFMKEEGDFGSKYDVLETKYLCTASNRGVKAGYFKSACDSVSRSRVTYIEANRVTLSPIKRSCRDTNSDKPLRYERLMWLFGFLQQSQ